MNVSDKIKAIITERDQRDNVITARSKLVNCKRVISGTVSSIQGIVDAGTFDMVDTAIKIELIKVLNIIKTANTALAKQSVVDVLGE